MFRSHNQVPRTVPLLAALCFAIIMAAFAAPAAWAANGLVLELIETRPEAATATWVAVEDGRVRQVDPYGGSYVSEHSWSAMPRTIGPNGFSISLQTRASNTTASGIKAGTSVSANSFDLDTAEPVAWAQVPVGAPGSNGSSKTVHLKPRSISPGSTVEIWVGGSYGKGVYYKYRAAEGVADNDGGNNGGGNDGGGEDDNRRLAAHLECEGAIGISALPSKVCHIVITNWRYSATPVQVVLPNALDVYGNHANGIQLLQAAGSQNVYSWSYPSPYRWGMFVFACPSERNVAANCFGSITPPGPQSVDIIVQQGNDVVPLRLTMNAVPPPDKPGRHGMNACGFTVGAAIFAKWTQFGGQGGVLGCATSAEMTSPNSPYGAQAVHAAFTGGFVFHHTAGVLTGSSFEVHGCIADRYRALGGPASGLGLPISDEFNVPGGRRSNFEGGYILWDAQTRHCIAMRGAGNSITNEDGVDRGGSDFFQFPVVSDRLEYCRDACAGNTSCMAYTYVRPGVQGPRAMCYLKSAVPAARADGCCSSGVKR